MATRNRRAPVAVSAREDRDEALAPRASTRRAPSHAAANVTPITRFPARSGRSGGKSGKSDVSGKHGTSAVSDKTGKSGKRAGSGTSAPPKRGAVIALRLATTPNERETIPRAEPRHEMRHEPRPAPAAARRTNSARKQFGELREALAGGWEIVQPVFARPLWSATDDSLTAFSFVLRRESGTRLVTVPGGRLVEKFIASQRLSVDERR